MKTNKILTTKIQELRMDVGEIVQELVDERNYWPDRFSDVNRIRLKNLRTIEKKLDRIHTRLLKNQ